MLLKTIFLAVLFAVVTAKAGGGVTFKNVVVRGFSMFVAKFNVTIKSSNSLQESLPDKIFDKLEIKDSEIPVLYESSIDLEDLDELILENNKIREIQPGALVNVSQLRKLVIKGNIQLEDIKNGVFNNLNIATLDLSKNSINKIASGAFDNMPELLNVNLADNQLRIWDKKWFTNTPLLTRVSMQNNLIEEIPADAFVNFQGEKQFGSVPLTINIVLSNNKIKKIDENAFNRLEKINNLWLDGNEIESLPGNLFSNTAVKDLRIENNKFQCLNGDLEKILVADTTHIDGNPWNCDCLKNIDAWRSKHHKNVIMFYSNMTCYAEHIDRKIKSLNQLLRELRKNDTNMSVNEI